jgi:hypothetical protein
VLKGAFMSVLVVASVGVAPLQRAGAATLFEAHVNFQPCSAPVPAGYVADCGRILREHEYGWTHNRIGFTRKRNLVSDERLDTLILLSSKRSEEQGWLIHVPAGTYDVTVGVGDPTGHGVSSVNVNGVPAISEFRSTATHPFWQATVTVSAGEFNQIGLNPNYEFRSRWDYVDIVQVS